MSSSAQRITQIDGLRGIAILSVVVLHWVVQPYEPLLTQWKVWNVFSLLAYGVDLFFVISGFLIGGILLRVGKNIAGIKSFYIRRILRIWPLYYALLGITFWLAKGSLSLYKIPFWTYTVFIFNFWENAGYIFHKALSALWSIAIEEQFYFFGPILFFLLDRKKLAYLAGGYLIAAPFIRIILLEYYKNGLWRFTPTRLDGIFVGILLALFFSSPQRAARIATKTRGIKILAAVLFILLPIFVYYEKIGHGFRYSYIAILMGLLVTLAQAQNISAQPPASILNAAFLQYIGMRCYSIYLFHIFFALITQTFLKNFFISLLVQSALTLLFAHFSWKYIEAPLIKLGAKFSYH